jgi:hypothetical protein
MTTIREVEAACREEPIVSELPPLAWVYLNDVAIYPSIAAFERDFDDPLHQFDHDVIIDTAEPPGSYQSMTITDDLISPELNSAVDWDDRGEFDRLTESLLPQSGFKSHIVDSAGDVDVIAVVVVDGLSYETVRTADHPILDSATIDPIVVDGVSETENGYRRVLFGSNKTSLYAELSMESYNAHHGFTYWEQGQETLSSDLHKAMNDANVHRIRSFEEIDGYLDASYFQSRTYLQITRMGLDQHAHNRKERPDRMGVTKTILDNIAWLSSWLEDRADSYRIHVTSDHGILWREHLPEDPPTVDTGSKTGSPRHVTGSKLVSHGHQMTGPTGAMTALAYPYLTRELKHTEWGVHGGLSYYESFVPLITLTNIQ